MIRVRIEGPKPAELALSAPLRLGPDHGLVGAEVQLIPHPLGVVMSASAEVAIQSDSHPAGRRRLLRPGDALVAGGVRIALEPVERLQPSTRLLARALLASEPVALPQVDVPRLIWLTGSGMGRQLVLPEGATFLGRGDGCAARVEDPCCSRVHAKLVREGKITRLVELGAPNGIAIDGVVLTGSTPLRGGETLRIGQTLLRVELPPPQPSEAPIAQSRPPEAAPVELPPPPVRRVAPHLSALERALLAVATGAVLVGGLLVGWALR